MDAVDTIKRWWWRRCQAMVSGTVVESVAGQFFPQLDDQVDGGLGSRLGLVCGRRDRGSNAASPSSR